MSALDEVRKCVLFVPNPTGPVVSAAACWSDGVHLWLPEIEVGPGAGGLPDGPVGLWLPAGAGRPAVLGSATVRAFTPASPLRALLHAPALAGASTGLLLGGGLRTVRSIGRRGGLLRVDLLRVRALDLPRAPGVAAALPPAAPAGVRRALAAVRDGVLATGTGTPVALLPVLLEADLRVVPRVAEPLPAPGTSAVLVLESAGTEPLGMALRGHIDEGGRLRAEWVEWWEDDAHGDAPVAVPGGVRLPD